jgi:O-succinylbenzoic acid--CoA ligase
MMDKTAGQRDCEDQPSEAQTLSLSTSGSTGNPSEVVLSAAALEFAIETGQQVLGNPGHWVLALPLDRIGGLLANKRSNGNLTVATPGHLGLVSALQTALAVPKLPKYVSLVPTQLRRLLDADQGSLLAAFEAVLVGGAGIAPDLISRAQSLGINLIATYGMTETSGGVVYNGSPLPGVTVRIRAIPLAEIQEIQMSAGLSETVEHGVIGRIEISGLTLAMGYRVAASSGLQPSRDDPLASLAIVRDQAGVAFADAGFLSQVTSGFYYDDEQRWFATADLGRLDSSGKLEVFGRLDDMVISGGVNVFPGQVEAIASAALADIAVRGVYAFGVADFEWGQRIVVVVETDRPQREIAELIAAAFENSEPALRPRTILTLPQVPTLVSGKVDRAQLRHLAAQ